MKKILTIATGILGILLVVAGVIAKVKKTVAFSIASADGPTSVFIAGKLGADISFGLIVAGLILIVIVVVFQTGEI